APVFRQNRGKIDAFCTSFALAALEHGPSGCRLCLWSGGAASRRPHPEERAARLEGGQQARCSFPPSRGDYSAVIETADVRPPQGEDTLFNLIRLQARRRSPPTWWRGCAGTRGRPASSPG